MTFIYLTLKSISTFILFLLINQYLFCPQYHFPAPHPFSGKKIYNPYANADSAQWRKCNFHAHTRAWKGFTSGSGSAGKLWNRYDSLAYDVHCISNYELVNRYRDTAVNYLSAYEHGYGFNKNHHLILNRQKVIRGDYYFPQTLSNKQHMLECLRVNDTALLCINHPLLSYGFAPDDMRILSGYDCIEVLRGDNTYSFLNWDAALESGKPVFMLANDDAHDNASTFEVARNCTWVNAGSSRANDIIQALKSGNAYGMIIGGSATETFGQKLARVNAGMPLLRYLHVTGDTIHLCVSEPAQRILFFGSGLQQLAPEQNGRNGEYILKSTDPYVRAQIFFDDGTQMVLNPLFRYDGKFPEQIMPEVNEVRTTLFRIMGGIILVVYIIAIILLPQRKH